MQLPIPLKKKKNLSAPPETHLTGFLPAFLYLSYFIFLDPLCYSHLFNVNVQWAFSLGDISIITVLSMTAFVIIIPKFDLLSRTPF